jgi:uncharacterized OB-fold protein
MKMVEDNDEYNIQNDDKNKKRLVQADRSLAASVISTKCEKCGRYYYKDEVHYCE